MYLQYLFCDGTDQSSLRGQGCYSLGQNCIELKSSLSMYPNTEEDYSCLSHSGEAPAGCSSVLLCFLVISEVYVFCIFSTMARIFT